MLGKMERKILACLLAAAVSIPTTMSWTVEAQAAESSGYVETVTGQDVSAEAGEYGEDITESMEESSDAQEGEEDFIPLETIVQGQKSEELETLPDQPSDAAELEAQKGQETQSSEAFVSDKTPGELREEMGEEAPDCLADEIREEIENVKAEAAQNLSSPASQGAQLQTEQKGTVVKKNQVYEQPEGEEIRFVYRAEKDEDLTVAAQDFRIVKVYQSVLTEGGTEPQEELIEQFIYGEEKMGYGTFSAKLGTDYIITVKPLAGCTVSWKLEESLREGDYVYTLRDDGTVELVKYIGAGANAVLPSSIKGQKVTQFSTYAFLDNETVESIVIPSTVTSFQYEPFKGCSSLKSVTVNEGSPIKEIPADTFRNLDALEQVTVHADIDEIGGSAFDSCPALRKVQIGGKPNEIGESAFYFCKSLQEVDIDLSELESLGIHAFDGTQSLKEMDLSASKLKKLERYVFYYSGLEKVLLPEGLTVIDWSAFTGTQMKSIHLPDSLTRIEEYAFSRVPLESLHLPDKVDFIGCFAFQSTNITSVKIPDSVTSLEFGAFSYCQYLKDIEIGDGLEEVSPCVFEKCAAESITIGNRVICLREWSFARNEQLTSITVPVNVTRIEYCAFKDCTNLAEINLPDTLEYIGYGAFDGTKWLADQQEGYVYVKNHLYQYKGEMTAKKPEIKAGTKGIVGDAFSGQKSLEEAEIPVGVRYIGRRAFYDCVNMKSVTIPMTVTVIESEALGWKEKDPESGHFSFYNRSEKIEDFEIRGVAGTAAETYAKENEFKFVPIEPQYIRGDLDGDYKVTISDLRYMLRSVCGKVQLDDLQKLAGDIAGSGADSGGDGKVDITDLRKLLRYICGKIEEL